MIGEKPTSSPSRADDAAVFTAKADALFGPGSGRNPW